MKLKQFYRYVFGFLLLVFVFTGCGSDNGGGAFLASDGNASGGGSSQTYSLKDGNHALMGPLKGATVKVYKLSDLDNSIEEVQTDNLGKFDVTLNGVADTEMLMVTISGGVDVDANDDGVLDDTPTPNSGTIHGFSKASELKNGNVNVTLLSEIVYQYTKHLIGEVHPDDLEKSINIISSKLLKDNINRSLRNYQSINNFVPTKKDLVQKLDFNYTVLLEGDNSISNLYHHDFNTTKIEAEFAHVFSGKALSFRDLRLQENNNYSKVILEQAIKSNITSTGTSLYIDYDSNTSKLVDFIAKGTSATFTITPQDDMKVLGWEGCDRVSNDILTCTLNISENSHRIVPNVVYKETKYADNVKDITDYQVSINDNNYTLSLDLDANTTSKEFISSIVVDDIIISSNPANPFFKKVISVKKVDNNNYIFITESTSFLKLYKQGSVFTNRYLTHEDLVAQNSSLNRSLLYKSHNGMRLLPPKHKNDDEFVIVFEERNNLNRSLGDTSDEITVPVADGVNIKGSISFKLKPEFSYNIGGFFSLKSMRFVVTKEMKVNLAVEATKAFELDREICRRLGKADDCNEFWKKRLAKYDFLIPGTPIVLDIELDASILLEAKIESSIKIGGEYARVTKTGFNYVNGNFSVIDSTSTNGAIIGEIKPINFTAGEYLKLSPIILINEIAGIELETKAGLYEECAPVSLSTSNLDGDTNFFAGKVDARISAELKWIWSDWLARFDWARNLGDKINQKIKDKTGGLNYVYSYNLYEWKGYQAGEHPAYLKLIPDIGTRNIKYDDESIDKHYVYRIKNEGEKKLKWKIETSGDLKDDLSISPKTGELEKGDYVDVDIYLQINDLSSKVGKHKAILKFINLSNTQGSNSETGTTTDEINLKVIERIAKPLNLNVELTGESIKQVKYTWTNGATENLHGHKIYMANYNSQTNSCNSNYINILTTLGNVDKYQVPFDAFKNNQKEEFKMEAGKKYCFKISSYKMIFDWLDSSLNESELSEEAILEIPAYGKLQSNITDKDNNPIENARVYLTSITTNTQTDGSGNYILENLLPGRYRVVAKADGYNSKSGYVTIVAGETATFERTLLAEDNLEGVEGTIGGKVQNALNGSGVGGVTIEIRKELNNLDGDIVKTITTDSNGNYSTTLETGAYTFSISANGYTSTSATINIFGNENQQKDLSLSPILSEGNMRIVLNWGENPRDLDSHLVKKVNGSQEYHIYYNAKSGTNGDNLDHDDTSSYGPETLTINNVDTSAVYTYYVHHYAGSSNLKSSSAKVDVYYGSHHFIYSVPNGDGIYWKVFEIVNGEVTSCTSNCIQSSTSSLIRKLDRRTNEFNIFRNLPKKD